MLAIILVNAKITKKKIIMHNERKKKPNQTKNYLSNKLFKF